ncbi:radical SAM/SPASM domain-containing protein [Pinirhizobacter soli]|uniref:radical SAM/SPASM domain-containing protein n=1 Tax=Pinirhizobacter soli TaxID=2786953 RepID=UPI002029FAD6|nr:radical SAM/SPASM domain-containing protein [Pinirhizobacter soli]
MIDNSLLGFGWYGAEAIDDHVWHWSRDIAELKTGDVDRVNLTFFTKYEETVGTPQTLTVVCNGGVRDRHTLSQGYQTISIQCGDADEVYLIADAFRPSEHDKASLDGRSLGIAITDIECISSSLPSTSVAQEKHRQLDPNGPPIMMQIEVSTACHLACVMCSRSARSGGRGEHMTDMVWDRLSVFTSAVDHVNILGMGEPWTHPKFLSWLEVIDRSGAHIYITTSGDLINEARAEKLGELRHLRMITFSVDSPDPDVYFKIRGQPLERALSGIRRTLEKVRDSDVVRVHAVVMRNNLQSLSGFPDLLHTLGVKRLAIRGVNNTKHATRDMVPDYTPMERATLVGMRKAAEDYGISVGMLPTLPADLIHAKVGEYDDELTNSPTDLAADDAVVVARSSRRSRIRTLGNELAIRLGARPRPRDEPLSPELRGYLDHRIAKSRTAATKICLDPWEKVFVTRSGEVFPCEAYHLQRSLGSLANETAEQLWLGETYRKFRQDLLEGRNVGCRNCERRSTGIHPFNKFAAEIVSVDIHLGAKSEIVLRNAGDEAWGGDIQVALATSRPRDRMQSRLFHGSWVGRNRLCYLSDKHVPPGGTATFKFLTTLPEEHGEPESLQFVVEGHCWLPNTEIPVPLG